MNDLAVKSASTRAPPMKSTDRVAFGYAVTDVTRLLRRVFDRRSLHLGLTRAQWRALHRIERVPGLSQSQLAEDLDLEAIAVGRVLDRLERAGFVERRADPEDRRRWNLFPAPKSAEVMTGMRRVANALHEDLLAGISDRDLETTLEVLAKVKETLVELDQARREPMRSRRSRK
jgi:MarR family transcriptional regulator for hemolysin